MRLESPTRIRARPPISPSARVLAASPSALRLPTDNVAYFPSCRQGHQHELAFPSSAGSVSPDPPRGRGEREREACQPTCSSQKESTHPSQGIFRSGPRHHKLRRKTRRLIDLLQDERTALKPAENGDGGLHPPRGLRPCARRSLSFGGDLCSVSGEEGQSKGDLGSCSPSSPPAAVGEEEEEEEEEDASGVGYCRSVDVIDLVSCSLSGKDHVDDLPSSPTICCGTNEGNVDTVTGSSSGELEAEYRLHDVSEDCDAREGTIRTQLYEKADLVFDGECMAPRVSTVYEADQYCADCVGKTTNNSSNHLCFASEGLIEGARWEAQSRKRQVKQEESESGFVKRRRQDLEEVPSPNHCSPAHSPREEEEARECVLNSSRANCGLRAETAVLDCYSGETRGNPCEEDGQKEFDGSNGDGTVVRSSVNGNCGTIETFVLESWLCETGEACEEEGKGVADGVESATLVQAYSNKRKCGSRIEIKKVNCWSDEKSGGMYEDNDVGVEVEEEEEEEKGVGGVECWELGPRAGSGSGRSDMLVSVWDEQEAYSDPLEHLTCVECRRGDGEDEMLICDKCERGYHMYCLCPILVSVPAGDWFCPKCQKKPEVKEFPMIQTKIVDFFRIARPLSEQSRSSLKRTKRPGRYTFSYKKRRSLLPHRPSADPARRLEQMASLATALTASGVEFSDRLTYVPGLAPRSCNRAQLELGGMQVMRKDSRAAYHLCKEMTKRGECAPLLVRHDNKQGFVVEAADAIPDLTIIAEYTGDVDFMRNRENDSGDCIMGLLTPADPDMELVICPDKRGNVARFLSGINNHDRGARKKINVRCVRFDVDGEAIALLVSVKDIRKGDFLYYDYNGLSQDGYPTHHFV